MYVYYVCSMNQEQSRVPDPSASTLSRASYWWVFIVRHGRLFAAHSHIPYQLTLPMRTKILAPPFRIRNVKRVSCRVTCGRSFCWVSWNFLLGAAWMLHVQIALYNSTRRQEAQRESDNEKLTEKQLRRLSLISTASQGNTIIPCLPPKLNSYFWYLPSLRVCPLKLSKH